MNLRRSTIVVQPDPDVDLLGAGAPQKHHDHYAFCSAISPPIQKKTLADEEEKMTSTTRARHRKIISAREGRKNGKGNHLFLSPLLNPMAKATCK